MRPGSLNFTAFAVQLTCRIELAGGPVRNGC
jgi:hypothetical protein